MPQYIILYKRHCLISYNNFYNSDGQISSIQTPPVGIGALDPPDCTTDADCADDVFCSGDETCVNGACEAGTDPCPGRFCNEGLDACVECLENEHCYDGAFCNGVETCDVGTGNCVNGDVPCNPDTETCAGGPDQAVCVPVDGEVVKIKVKVPRFINPKNRGVTPIKLVSDMDVEFAEVTCGDAQHERPRQKYFSKYDKTLAIGKFKTKDLGFECGYNMTLTCTGKFADGTEFMGESNKFKCKYKRKDDYDDYDDDKRGHYNDDDDKRDRDDDDDDDDDRNKRYSYKRD